VHSTTEWTTVLANLASGGASWHALCPPRSDFEGGVLKSSVESSSVRRLEGAADGRSYGAQQLVWRRLVASYPHSVGDGDAVPGMVLGRRGWPLLTVYFCTPSMFITLWFGFDYGTNPPLGTLII
jgi:hypothetical protein